MCWREVKPHVPNTGSHCDALEALGAGGNHGRTYRLNVVSIIVEGGSIVRLSGSRRRLAKPAAPSAGDAIRGIGNDAPCLYARDDVAAVRVVERCATYDDGICHPSPD